MLVLLYIVSVISIEEKSICMNDFLAFNYEDDQTPVVDQFDCYSDLPDPIKVKGINNQALCYVSKKFMYMTKDNNTVNRCGEYLQIVGSYQKQVFCMIAGFMDVYKEKVTEVLEGKYISVNNRIYNQLSPKTKEQHNYACQFTFKHVYFDLGMNPSLEVVKRKQNSTLIQIINSNQIIFRIRIYSDTIDEFFLPLDDGKFEIPNYEGNYTIRVNSFYNNRLEIADINLDQDDSFEFDSRFPSDKGGNCYYVVNNDIYSPEEKNESVFFLKWHVLQPDYAINLVNKEKTPGGIIFEPTDEVNGKGFISIGYVYITEMMLDQDFTHVQFELEMEDTTDFELILADLVYKTDFVEFTNTSFEFVDKDLKTKYYITDKKVSINAYYKPYRKEFSNGGSIKFLVTKGSYVRLQNITLFRSDLANNQYICDSNSFDCFGTECQITNESYPQGTNIWRENCRPECGFCREGFVCTTAGKCIIEPNDNLRSGISKVITLLCLVIIFAV
ncbi:hypothetical protein EIN_271600 [Entamoeba invadens IP1]|uniref:Uncharacterized protein n=1 Tax=Entamoeba invadens IP1 TaxID=370355 RepID=A0A0A1U6D7_ENTIV|nr:hypothetical protein EIN_271600 [Entamoeba invadens IP1]ELP89855.1 hypothetical protein EIN_271600 [Entamoeba invadens IP1]|eukprot:XP_004256626.1 hypothetical protein EIN_271600 [Entamoeba invadens IP1]